MSQLNGIDEAVCRVQVQRGNAMPNDNEVGVAIERIVPPPAYRKLLAMQLTALADEPAVQRLIVHAFLRFTGSAEASASAALKALANACQEK